ncbi:MAG: SAM-dependent chlorinase/fluorinase [Chloroflexota bacterium]|nr:SAM-dependent chlorinase/fluorinase [Chloroflexota bacterium]
MNSSVVALLTDFGQTDHYVGVMKCVVAGIAPAAQLIDISHAVPPQSILAGQRLIRASYPYLPEGAVLLAVVDPGVGTQRRAIALHSHDRFFVGPDNGLLTPLLDGRWQAVELTNPRYRLPATSATFHGRDVFAPAAAHLAAGVPLADLGPPVADLLRLDVPEPIIAPDGTVRGEIVYMDHFGNLVSNISRTPGGGKVSFHGLDLPVVLTYGEVPVGQPLALVGSDGQLEIAVRNGNAARSLNANVGDPVTLS